MLIVPVQLFYLLEIDKTHLGFRSLNSIFVDKVIPSGDLHVAVNEKCMYQLMSKLHKPYIQI